MIEQSEIDGDDIVITIRLPYKQTGTYTYEEDSTWTTDNLVVVIDRDNYEYTLNHLIYLDYKDSLQEGMPYLNFDTEVEAVVFANKHKINISYLNGYKG